ncbi:nucleolar protein 6-like isoform X2 [Pomacea canaliculata]|uniref:nucleolar protein 6-like isoform X2 n=1 Tax=Pomacea canaliculata TaxID=400727 RepID=UPI000D732675|nr:nucleolar protein 6-like isoform X2 [Pomacea canaliculata]
MGEKTETKFVQKRKATEKNDEISQKRKKKKMQGNEKEVPTAEEMRELKNAGRNAHTNLCQMQMAALLAEVRMKKKQHAQMMEAVEKIKNIFLQLSAEDTEFPLPVDVFQSGSIPLNACVQPTKAADVVLVMPKKHIYNKDYRNHQYLHKRLQYLTAVAGHLKEVAADIKLTYRAGNPFHPILVVNVPVSGSKALVVIHLHVIPEQGAFKPGRFHLSKNNIRPCWFSSGLKESSLFADYGDTLPPTPYYNTSILQDVCFKTNAEYITQQLSDSSSLQDGLALFKMWLYQRQLDKGFGSFNGFVATMYVCYLLSQKVLNHSMNSYQVLRHTLTSLSMSTWEDIPMTLCSETGLAGQPSMEEFQQTFDIVFVDVTGFTNICLGMTSSFYKRVRHEAVIAVQCFSSEFTNTFDLLLMSPITFVQKFDSIFHMECNKEVVAAVIKKCQLSQHMLDLGDHVILAVIPTLLQLMTKGLGERVELVQVQPHSPPEWSVFEDPPTAVTDSILTFGLLLREAKALNIVDRGPNASSEEAVKFRQFWGEKSELRRFKDGSSIIEAVKWATSTSLKKRRAVCNHIVSYVLHKHADINPKWIHHVGHQVERVLYIPRCVVAIIKRGQGSTEPEKKKLSTFDFNYGTGEEWHYHLRKSLEELGQMLRTLPNLPLSINAVSGISPVCRFTEVFPPCPAPPDLTRLSLQSSDPRWVPWYTPSVTVICKLEGSGKWPEDLEAICRLKAAYYVKLGQILAACHQLMVDVSPTHLDVLKDGFVFRLKLGLTREIGVLRLMQNHDGMSRMEDTPEALALEAEITTLPHLTGWLQGIQQSHQSFCAVVRLVKRWVSAQLLLCHIPELTVEKTVAQLYTQPLPFTPPVSPVTGLLRYLRLVSRDDYRLENFTEKAWPVPLAVISNRLHLVAQASLATLQDQMVKCQADWKVIFRPPLEGYDVVVHLSQELLPRHYQAIDSEKNISALKQKYRYLSKRQQDADTMPMLDFDPASLLIEELKSAYGEMGLIFHDQFGGDVIGILWKPGVMEEKEFKVPNMTARKPAISESSDIALTLNLEAIADDIRVLGGDLVSRVDVKVKNRCS